MSKICFEYWWNWMSLYEMDYWTMYKYYVWVFSLLLGQTISAVRSSMWPFQTDFLLSVCQLALVRCWKEHPRKLDVHKSIGPDGMSSKLLRELTMSLWGRSPSSLNSHCMWGRFLRQVYLRHLAMKTSVFKERNSGNWTSVPGKVRR